MLRGGTSDNDIKNNTFAANRIGILVNGATDTELKDNVISGSSLAGIRFNNAATGNSVKDNILTANVTGIEFLVTPPLGSSVGNEFKGNSLTGNGCGLWGLTADNTFKDNTFAGNVADAC
jgi:parallel beta-helix repeat protein